MIGHRWSERSWEVRQFLARNLHSFRAFNADEPKGKQLLDAGGLDEFQLPVVISEQGQILVDPTDAELAAMLGLSTSPSLEMYDLAVIGGGPAGLAAAVYGASEGLKTVLIEETTTVHWFSVDIAGNAEGGYDPDGDARNHRRGTWTITD